MAISLPDRDLSSAEDPVTGQIVIGVRARALMIRPP
jgi:hypothetical protein